ncbi:MFS general substrate transporter [Armillaria mellea]|nr:MFS general substrate transporter [Armillaria mellea]
MSTSIVTIHEASRAENIELREVNPNIHSNTNTESEVVEDPGEDKRKRMKGRVHYVTLCWFMFLAGWNDGTTGPLIPRMQTVYDGFLTGAFANILLTPKLGFGKLMVLGSLFQVIAYTLQAPALPFPVFVIAYMINGVGLAFQDAQANGYVACYKHNPESKMGLLHAVYGAGALCAPLVATQFAYLPHWSFHYLVSLGLALRTQDECLAEIGESSGERGASQHSPLRQILSLKNVHLLASFILVYVGVEFTLGGWIVTYVIQLRGGGENAGYISSGFFAGLTVGRLALLWVNKLVGERRVLFIYALFAIGLEVVVWRVPSLIGGCIGWIAGFGQAGTAVFPFITGAMANSVGISSLQPMLVAMMGLMMVLWVIVPSERPKMM